MLKWLGSVSLFSALLFPKIAKKRPLFFLFWGEIIAASLYLGASWSLGVHPLSWLSSWLKNELDESFMAYGPCGFECCLCEQRRTPFVNIYRGFSLSQGSIIKLTFGLVYVSNIYVQISNFEFLIILKSEIPNFKSQISYLKFQISNFKSHYYGLVADIK